MIKNQSLIAACLVVYNEEKNIRRCLKSLKGIVDEIIVVHDGKCSDKTLEIAKEFTNKIYIQPHIGEAEPHREFSFSKASSEWILQIDADEAISQELKNNLKILISNKDINGYYLYWPKMYKGKYITHGPLSDSYKLCLFRKHKVKLTGIPHEIPSIEGRTKKVNYQLEHYEKFKNDWESFKTKSMKWAIIDAKYRIKNGYAPKNKYYYLIKGTTYFFLGLGMNFFKGYFLNGWIGIQHSFFSAAYYFFINYNIFKLK